ncbi:MAG: AAA family ATPase [Gammaproteobacteria bacterium]|nr:AAA family ATPase [Gammaproteobacteria bacterium]
MYYDYFGLDTSPFSLTPDPRFLYLSDEHREALAHLMFSSGEGGGFVLLTGEVGTGKTTICRAFLDQLPQQVEVALILNPKLSAAELLCAICDEFGIEFPPDTGSAPVLINLLNRYLLQAHAEHRRPVVLIDEAQNLSSAVLEQVRLLTNLETHTHKLLQIFLIGQPELRQKLNRPELRQLAQRITAHYHLGALTKSECQAYLKHRLAVAGVTRPLFTPAAIRRIHHHSNGIPRLINLLCDRALLGAYATEQHRIGRRIVDRASREIFATASQYKADSRWPVVAVSLLLLAALVLLAYRWQQSAQRQTATATPAAPASEYRTGRAAAAMWELAARERESNDTSTPHATARRRPMTA